jgi:hypothetical protein
MNKPNSLSFEEKLQIAVETPQPRPEFLTSLRARLADEAPRPVSWLERLGLTFHRPAWAASMVGLLLLISFYIVGPQRVLAAVQRLFGYIPGVGIVDTSAPIRVLAEPVTVTKKDIKITVASAFLSVNRTHIEFSIFGVPDSAYPSPKSGPGCIKANYLRLPDGKQVGPDDSVYYPVPSKEDFLPIPANVNDTVLVIPCIFNTMPGTVPENWEIPLRFKPAPSDMALMPVIELSPSPQAHPTGAEPTTKSNNGSSITPSTECNVVVQKVIETADGYILVGVFHPLHGELSGPDGKFEIRDASGKNVDFSYPQDIKLDISGAKPNDIPWATQFKAAGLVYPLTISFPMVILNQPDPTATAEFEVDAGANPQNGQELASNQEINLLGHTLKLVSLKGDPSDVYDFTIKVDSQVDSANVNIEGYTPKGFGGGGKMDGMFNRRLSFAQMPTGKLKVIVSDLTLISKRVNWQGQWSPQP